MKEAQAKIIESCIQLLNSTLGTMSSSDADRVVKGVSEILASVASTLRQLK